MLNWSAASRSRSRVVGEDGVLTLEGEGASSPLSATTTRDSTERGPFCREGEWGPVEVAKSRGHEVKVIKYKNAYASIEQNNPKLSYRGKELGHFDAIIPRIASNMTRYGTAMLRQMETQGMYTVSSSIAINRTRDKLRSMQLLSRAGVAIPKTVFSRNTADIDDLIEMVGGVPVVIKLARGTHGNGVVLAESKRMAKSALQALYLNNEDGTNILVQEYIKESAGTDIRAFVVGGRVVASMQRQSLDDDFRSNLHKGGEVLS